MIRAAVYTTSADDRPRLGRIDGEELVDAGPAAAGGFVPTPDAWKALAAADGARMAVADVRLRAPVAPGKVVCVGLNYRDHAAEARAPLPDRPLLFAKFPSAIVGPEDPVIIDEDDHVDWEAELALIIGQGAGPGQGAWKRSIGGYTALNDISARAVQLSEGQWTRGKSFDTFAPIGPTIVRADADLEWSQLSVRCRLNGELVQDGNTRDLIFGAEELVRFVAGRITLDPGDIIATGTPAGVGMAHEPPRFLRNGDNLQTEVGDAGLLANPVHARRMLAEVEGGQPGPGGSAGAANATIR